LAQVAQRSAHGARGIGNVVGDHCLRPRAALHDGHAASWAALYCSLAPAWPPSDRRPPHLIQMDNPLNLKRCEGVLHLVQHDLSTSSRLPARSRFGEQPVAEVVEYELECFAGWLSWLVDEVLRQH
jgi:hypothetical protein